MQSRGQTGRAIPCITRVFITCAAPRSKQARRLRQNLRRIAMTPHTPTEIGHSERESDAHKKFKESHFMNATHFLRRTLFVLLVVAFAAIGAQAQLSTASLSGSITDPAGAVVPQAKITLIQTDTNFTRIATSKDDGSFQEEFLPVGPYKVSACGTG